MNGSRAGAGARERLYVSTTATYDPQLDLDFIAIEFAINGERVKLTMAEKIYAARILDSRGLAIKEIGRCVGSDSSTVAGWKTNGWKPGPASKAPMPKRPDPVCGEPRMYRRHLARGETPCEACRGANAAADRRYRLTGSRREAAASVEPTGQVA